MKAINHKKTIAWAWAIQEGLCCWAAPSKHDLLKEGKPSPEAKMIRVAIVPLSEYRKLQRKAKP